MTQPEAYASAVMDVFPWDRGQGFINADLWWRYVGSRSEAERLELLIMTALINVEVARRLLRHDPALYARFGLSENFRRRHLPIHARSLETFTEQLINRCSSESEGDQR
jgi:hypothetical protein